MSTTAADCCCTQSSHHPGPRGPSAPSGGQSQTGGCGWPAWVVRPAGSWHCAAASAGGGAQACVGTPRSGAGGAHAWLGTAGEVRWVVPAVSSVCMHCEGTGMSALAVSESACARAGGCAAGCRPGPGDPPCDARAGGGRSSVFGSRSSGNSVEQAWPASAVGVWVSRPLAECGAHSSWTWQNAAGS